jgi:hypothetical protein
MTAVAEGSAPTYLQLLEEAQEIGRMDGRFAAAFEAPGSPVPDTTRCLGRTPAEFAALLWEGLPGSPPSGLELNAPAWYAAGFAEGLAVRAVELARVAEWARTRRVFT